MLQYGEIQPVRQVRMATGIPRRRTAHRGPSPKVGTFAASRSGFQLMYEGKRAEGEILDTPSAFIEALRQRLVLIREVLAEDGSIYVHLDKNMAFGVKLVMDEVFGPNNFRNWITRKKCNPKNYTTKTYGNVADYLLFYSKSANYVWNRPVVSWTEEG